MLKKTICMSVMNKDNIFNLFSDPDNLSDAEVSEKIVESPHYKIGMFTKIVLGQKRFLRQIEHFYNQAGKKIDIEEHDKHSRFVVYNRGWHYIKDIDLNQKNHLMDLVVGNIYDLAYALQLALKYFESTEEYEKCAHLFKIQQFLDEFESNNEGNMTFIENVKNMLEK